MSYQTERAAGAAHPIHRAVRHAYHSNAFYRAKLDAAGVTPDRVWRESDLARLPFTERSELVNDPWVLLADQRHNIVQAHASTGTTRERPVYVFFNWDDLMVRGLEPLLAERAAGGLLGIQRGELVVNALPYEVSVTGHAIHRALQDGIGACVVAVGKGGFYAEPSKTLRVCARLEAKHLFTTPSYAGHLAELRQTLPSASASWRPASVWLIGEPCSDAYRDWLQRSWGAAVRRYYGSMECGAIGIECGQGSGYHVATRHVHVEVVPRELPALGRPVPGIGELAVTTFSRHASPVLRYLTRDIGFFEPTACACGSTAPRLQILGRRSDLHPIGGRHFFTSELEQVLLSVPGVHPSFRLRISTNGLTVSLPTPTDASVAGTVQSALRGLCGVSATVEWVAPAPYAGGKIERVSREESL